MARPKRKAAGGDESPALAPNKRQKNSVGTTASSARPSRRTSIAEAPEPMTTRSSGKSDSSTAKKESGKPQKSVKEKTSVNGTPAKKPVSKTKTTRTRKKSVKSTAEEDETTNTSIKISVDVTPRKKTASDAKTVHDSELEETGDRPSYWLMKAEPDSRIEKGKDVKFSIDDLKAATKPEPWNGIRNFVARNNMRLMMKGDLAFFYHSNCKAPGIAGIMEIVEEHSVDETAFDSQDPYYDEKSDREKPKWCLVHVEFRQKFPELIKLKDLQKYAKAGGVLENMQTFKQSRLSVSKVSKKEWDFIMSLVDMDDVAAASDQHQPKMTG